MTGAYSALIRYGSLGIVVLQTTATVLLLRYSRTHNEPYLASTAVLSSEIVKFIVCLITLVIYAGNSFNDAAKAFLNEIVLKPRETAKLIVPSGLYALQNNLLYIALSNLDAATYQVTYQLKILTTALFSVFLLKKHITSLQWLSLLLLTIGVALVQLPENTFSSESGDDETAQLNPPHINQSVGLLAVLTACFSSGLAGVYFEMLVKVGKQTSIVIRNLQLGLFSLVFASMAVMWKDSEAVWKGGFFQGYTTLVVILVLIQAFGGLMVAVAVKYADNILKVFATSISIILSTVCSYFLLNDLSTGPLFLTGATCVIFATILYGKSGSKIALSPAKDFKRKSSPVISDCNDRKA